MTLLRAAWIAVVISAGLFGCGTYTTPTVAPRKLSRARRNFENLWQASRRVLRKYCFEIDREDRRGGVITTRPMTGRHYFEFWRRDAVRPQDVAESSLQTIYRLAEVRIRPSAGAAGRFVPSVRVRVYRLDRKDMQVTSTSDAYRLLAMPRATRRERRIYQTGAAGLSAGAKAGEVNLLGRDTRLEARLTGEIKAAARAGERVKKHARATKTRPAR